jgi:hypothetical protein
MRRGEAAYKRTSAYQEVKGKAVPAAPPRHTSEDLLDA